MLDYPLVPVATGETASAAAQAWLWLVERETFRPLHLVRDVVVATLAILAVGASLPWYVPRTPGPPRARPTYETPVRDALQGIGTVVS